ncbi:MAG TPA: IS66 family transposase [Verrucomicrobiae bacterium]
MTDDTLLKKFEELSARMSALETQNTGLREENTQLRTENRLLRQKLDQYIRHYFGGQRNEGLDKQQMELLLQGLPNIIALPSPDPKPAAASRSGTPHPVRRMLAEDKLETQEIVIEPEEIKAQPDGWKKISEERTSQLDWVAPKIIKRVFIRPRYVKAERFALAPLPPQPIEQGMVGPSLLAQVILNKFEYHLPLYRQEKMFRQQFGVELSRKTMGCWAEQASELMKPVYRAIREDLLAGFYLQADETPIRYLDPDVKGKSQQGYLWAYSRPGGDVLFEWQVSRSREGPVNFLKSFHGKLQTDGYAAYESLAKERDGDLILIGCWAHTRRGFHEALSESKLAAWFVRQIGLLYAVEKELREKKTGPQLRAAMRVWQSRPVLARLRRAMELVRQRTLPQGLLGQAIDYALKRWEALNRFVDDGTLEIDNNLIENAIRPSALGKKNWLFIGHPEAGERSAVIYTLLGSCRRHGINPFDYLKDLFTRLPAAKITQIKEFRPMEWAKAKAKAKLVDQAA